MNIPVESGQSVFDIAMQHCGDTSAVIDICLLNNISVDEVLTPGQFLEIPEPVNKDVVLYLKNERIIPAGDYDISARPRGIGFDIIGINNIVG